MIPRNTIYAVVGLVLAVLWLNSVRQEGATKARAEIAEARADSAYLYAREMQDAFEEELKTRDVEILRFAEQRDSAVARADRLAARRPAIVERIREVAGDSAAVVDAVEELEAAHQQETDALRQALAAADSTSEQRRLLLVEATYVNEQLRNALETSRAESRAWEAASAPKLLGLIPATPNGAFVGGVVATAGVVVWMVLR